MIRAALAAVAALAICATASASPHVVWTARLSAPVGTPTVADGHIYVATGAKHTRLHALDAATGRRQWQAIGGLGTQFAPLAADGIVLRLSNVNYLRRYDPATGRIFWSVPSLFSEGFLAQPTLAGGRIVELSDSLAVLDARTGEKLWSTPDDCFRCQAAATETRVYAAGKQGLRAFDAATGGVVWHAKGFAALNTVSSTTLSGSIVVVVETKLSGKTWSFFLEGFRASDGHALWHTKLADADGFDPWAVPAASDGLVLYSAVDGNLYALDAQTGAIRWRAHVGTSDSTPVIVNGTVWVVSDDNRLHELSAATGATVWAGPPLKVDKNAATPSPVLDGDLVIVGTAAGNLLAFSQR